MKSIIGVDVGGTYVRMGVVYEDGSLACFNMYETAEFIEKGTFMGNLQNHIKSLLDNYPSLGISIGFPSTIDKGRRTLLSTPNIPGLDDLNVADILEGFFNLPVLLEKDVNNLLIQDMARLNLTEDRDTLGFYIGTGIGNAIFLNGRMLHGAHGVAGELGHTPLYKAMDVCNCGNPGCAETYIGGLALQRLQEKNFPGTPMPDLFKLHNGDEIILGYITDLSVLIAAEINILDPNCVIIGGGIIKMNGFPHKKLEEEIMARTRKPYPACGLVIHYSKGDQTDGVIGAGINGFKNFSAVSRHVSTPAR